MAIHETLRQLRQNLDPEAAGQELHDWVEAWYPIPRSITGAGIRAQFEHMSAHIPLEVTAIPSGTALFDWTAPKEWNVRDAWVKNASGQKVIDWQAHNLHLLGYSVPVHATLSLQELKARCFSLPDQPTWIPFRNSFYKENWGFCVSQEVLDGLPEGDYEVCIDSTLEDGVLNYAECYLPGETEEEVLISAHACHPSLANDNLSGLAVATWLARELQGKTTRYSYRFVFAPGTIGAIAWLAMNKDRVDRVDRVAHGLILACLGDGGHSTYKQSRRGDAPVDRAVAHVLALSGAAHEIVPFSPYGYDERQYCSPGFNLPVGCLMRTRPGGYPEYHSSADNPSLVQPASLADSLGKLLVVLDILERDATYTNTAPHCEPMLGKRGLYSAIGGRTDTKAVEMALLWVLNYSDGGHSLLDIAKKANMEFDAVRGAADALLSAELLSPTC